MSIIDSLIVELKIDASDFSRGQKKAKEGMAVLQKGAKRTALVSIKGGKDIQTSQNRLSNNSTKTARSMSKSGQDASGFFSKIRNEAIMMLGVFTAGTGLKNFAQNTINAASSTGILASQIGVNISQLSAMEAAAQRAGAASGSMSTQLAEDAKKRADVKAGGSVTDIYGSKFIQFGGDYKNMDTAENQLKEYAKIYGNLKNKAVSDMGMDEKGADAFASQQITETGLSGDLIPLINKGSASLERQIKIQLSRIAITNKDAKAARRSKEAWFDLSQKFDQVSQRVVMALIPSLERLTEWLGRIELPNAREIADTIAVWTGKLETFIDVAKNAAKKIDVFVESIGGWVTVLKVLVGIKLLAWGIGLATIVTGLAGFTSGAGLAAGAAKLLSGALVPLFGVIAAGAAGAWVGDKINDALPQDIKNSLRDTLGKGVAKSMAFFGHEESKEAVNPSYKGTGGISKVGSVASIIQSGESGTREYNAYNRGSSKLDRRGGTPSQNIAGLTIGEIQRRQKLKHGDKQRLFAVGKYQVIKDTLSEAVNSMGLKKTDRFSPEVQDKIFSKFLAGKRRKAMKSYITGKSNNKNQAILSASKEWASIADPRTGRSYYAGKGGNKAHISTKKMGDSFENARKIYAQNKKKGLSDDQSYHLALQGVNHAKKNISRKKTPRKDFKIKRVRNKETGKLENVKVPNKPPLKTKPFKIKTVKDAKTGKLKRLNVPPRIPQSQLASTGSSTVKTQKNNIVINVKSTDPKEAAIEIKTTLDESLTSNFISGVL